MNRYKSKADLLKRKYGKITDGFESFKDDRLLVVNMLNQVLEVCKVMENIENPFIRVAVNEKIEESIKVIDEIITRFTNKVWVLFEWIEIEKIDVTGRRMK